MGKEKFDRLVPVLVQQLEVAYYVRSSSDYTAFVTRLLGPAITEMAMLMANFTLWKPLNHGVLLMTRKKSALLRLNALRVVHDLFQKLGPSYLVMVPESLPFIAELMDDPDSDVERLCHQLGQVIEAHSGESLDDLLKK